MILQHDVRGILRSCLSIALRILTAHTSCVISTRTLKMAGFSPWPELAREVNHFFVKEYGKLSFSSLFFFQSSKNFPLKPSET